MLSGYKGLGPASSSTTAIPGVCVCGGGGGVAQSQINSHKTYFKKSLINKTFEKIVARPAEAWGRGGEGGGWHVTPARYPMLQLIWFYKICGKH